MLTRAAILSTVNEPLVIDDVELDEPHRGELLVRMVASGICHTDISASRGARPIPLPVVLGHEGAGVVMAVGPDVSSLAVGDHVVVTAVPHCGRCGSCRRGKPFFCQEFRSLAFGGAMPDGTKRFRRGPSEVGHFFCQSSFAEHAVVSARATVKIPLQVPLEKAAALGCGVETGAGAVLNTARVRPGESVAILGCGGVGLSAVMAARLAGASPVIAVDVSARRLELARDLGATETMQAGQGDVVREVRKLTRGGVDYAFECIGRAETIRQSVDCARVGGTAVISGGVPAGSEIVLDGAGLLFREIRGNHQGSSVPGVFIPLLIDLWTRGEFPFDRLLSRPYGLNEINQAIADMERGDVVKPLIRHG
jgi:aryl-alcohol dehydrogenase